MPLVAHNSLPTFDKLKQDGFEILKSDHALHQDIRELHIGLLNMMPDAALRATERQFMRMVTSCNQIAQFYIHPFTIDGIERGEAAQTHIDKYYQHFDELKSQGLDALIISGANPSKAELTDEGYWPGVVDVFEWAKENVTSILCSCLASHAAFKQFYGVERRRLDNKLWGVFSHRITEPAHPLVSNINTRFDVPHSRFNEVTRQQLESAGLKVLIEGPQSGVHLAVSQDLFREVYFQGHPEYNFNSLLKEYKREVLRFYAGDRNDYPLEPDNYFVENAQPLLESYKAEVIKAKSDKMPLPQFPESEFEKLVDNTWWDTGKAVFNNWLGLVYQLTHMDRKKLFMDGVNVDDPLNLKATLDQ